MSPAATAAPEAPPRPTLARTAMEAGATGLIFGRNMWQRPFDEALEMTGRVQEVLKEFPS